MVVVPPSFFIHLLQLPATITTPTEHIDVAERVRAGYSRGTVYIVLLMPNKDVNIRIKLTSVDHIESSMDASKWHHILIVKAGAGDLEGLKAHLDAPLDGGTCVR